MQLLRPQKEIACLSEELSNVKSRLGTDEADLVNSKVEINRRSQEKQRLDCRNCRKIFVIIVPLKKR